MGTNIANREWEHIEPIHSSCKNSHLAKSLACFLSTKSLNTDCSHALMLSQIFSCVVPAPSSGPMTHCPYYMAKKHCSY